jgi:polynucleotide 5'-kinase involved in rRNA processing
MGRQKENKKLVPDEIATSILEYLPITVLILLKCELISKQFNTITNPFWKRLWNAEHDIKLKRNHRFACIQLFLYINKKRSHSMYPSTIYGFETKLVVLGNMNSGKSSFVQRFITNQFVANIDPTMYGFVVTLTV